MKIFRLLSFLLLASFLSVSQFVLAEDEFVPAYQNEANYDLEDPEKYFTYQGGRTYYTSGKKNGFRINENNEESTDETVGILTFILSPAALVYMNLIGWWD